MDFTIEQFGHGGERWFLPFDEYMSMTQDGSWRICGYEDRGVDLQGTFEDEHLRGQKVMRKLCDDIDWAAVQQMAENDRIALVNEMTSRALLEED